MKEGAPVTIRSAPLTSFSCCGPEEPRRRRRPPRRRVRSPEREHATVERPLSSGFAMGALPQSPQAAAAFVRLDLSRAEAVVVHRRTSGSDGARSRAASAGGSAGGEVQVIPAATLLGLGFHFCSSICIKNLSFLFDFFRFMVESIFSISIYSQE